MAWTPRSREVDEVLRALLPSELLERRSIQGRDTTVMEAVYHVVEHFAGHTGQIIWIAKMAAAPGAVKFYEDGDGTATPLFLAEGEFEMGTPGTKAKGQGQDLTSGSWVGLSVLSLGLVRLTSSQSLSSTSRPAVGTSIPRSAASLSIAVHRLTNFSFALSSASAAWTPLLRQRFTTAKSRSPSSASRSA